MEPTGFWFLIHPSTTECHCGLNDNGDRFTGEAQRPDNRLHIRVCAPFYCCMGWPLTKFVHQLTELRDKLDETLADEIRLTSSALNENTPIF